jgi:hypothetical protein
MVLLAEDAGLGATAYMKYLYWATDLFGFDPGLGWVYNNLGMLQTFTEQLVVPHAMAISNQVLVNSGINTKLNLIHIESLAFKETGDFDKDVISLHDPIDGNGDDAHALRNKYAADMVILISNTHDYTKQCGVAYDVPQTVSHQWEDDAFAVVVARCFLKQFTFVHEIGHIMGARHDWYKDATNGQPFDYNHGFTFDPGGFAVRTVMAYPDQCKDQGAIVCIQVATFSDGGPTFGKPIGSNQAADNAEALNQTRWTISNYRPSWCRTHDCSAWF